MAENVKLVSIASVLLWWSFVYVGEDAGGGGIFRFDCYNAGEPEVPLVDDISNYFPNENIWSGMEDHPGNFRGGLGWTEKGPGSIGASLQLGNMDPLAIDLFKE